MTSLMEFCKDQTDSHGFFTGREDREQYESLRIQVDRFFWDEEKHAYIDSFISGRGLSASHYVGRKDPSYGNNIKSLVRGQGNGCRIFIPRRSARLRSDFPI